MLMLTERIEIWRWQAKQPSGKALQVYRRNVPALVVPISDYDALVDYARESTHLIYLPRWVTDLTTEDEVRYGRRVTPQGTSAQVFTVVGVRRYPAFGLRHAEAFARERL